MRAQREREREREREKHTYAQKHAHIHKHSAISKHSPQLISLNTINSPERQSRLLRIPRRGHLLSYPAPYCRTNYLKFSQNLHESIFLWIVTTFEQLDQWILAKLVEQNQLIKLHKISPKISEFLTSCGSNRGEETVLSQLFLVEMRRSTTLYSVQWVTFFRTRATALLRFNWYQRKIPLRKFIENSLRMFFNDAAVDSIFDYFHTNMFLASCNWLNCHNIYKFIYITTR